MSCLLQRANWHIIYTAAAESSVMHSMTALVAGAMRHPTQLTSVPAIESLATVRRRSAEHRFQTAVVATCSIQLHPPQKAVVRVRSVE